MAVVGTGPATPLYFALADKPAQQRVWIASAISIPNAADVCIDADDARRRATGGPFSFFLIEIITGTERIVSDIFAIPFLFDLDSFSFGSELFIYLIIFVIYHHWGSIQ